GQLTIIIALIWAYLALRGGQVGHAARVLTLGAVASQALMFAGLLRTGSAPRSRHDRSKFFLDIATISCGGLLVLWYDLRRPLIEGFELLAIDLVIAHTAIIGDLVLLMTASVLWRRTTIQSRANVLVVLGLAL